MSGALLLSEHYILRHIWDRSQLLFAPTEGSRQELLREGCPAEDVGGCASQIARGQAIRLYHRPSPGVLCFTKNLLGAEVDDLIAQSVKRNRFLA